MKPSRALALYGITLDELIEAFRAGDVFTRDRWGKQDLIPPHRWRQPPKPIEVLDQEVDVDPKLRRRRSAMPLWRQQA